MTKITKTANTAAKPSRAVKSVELLKIVSDAGASPPTPEVSATPPAKPSKQSEVIAMLGRAKGASLDEMVAATSWLPHTTRAMLTGLKKKGHALSSEKIDGVRRYRIVEASGAGA